jgi:hypothetical protein
VIRHSTAVILWLYVCDATSARGGMLWHLLLLRELVWLLRFSDLPDNSLHKGTHKVHAGHRLTGPAQHNCMPVMIDSVGW